MCYQHPSIELFVIKVLDFVQIDQIIETINLYVCR